MVQAFVELQDSRDPQALEDLLVVQEEPVHQEREVQQDQLEVPVPPVHPGHLDWEVSQVKCLIRRLFVNFKL